MMDDQQSSLDYLSNQVLFSLSYVFLFILYHYGYCVTGKLSIYIVIKPVELESL